MLTPSVFLPAFDSSNPAQTLRRQVIDLLQQGHPREEIQTALESLVLSLREQDRSGDEETVLDLLDALTGWCHPSAKIPNA